MEETKTLAASPETAPCWSNVVKTQAPPKPAKNLNAANRIFAESCKSSKCISVAVVDANAIIEGGERLSHCADKFVSVAEVGDEIRDPVSRHRLAFVPFTVESMEPSPEALNKDSLSEAGSVGNKSEAQSENIEYVEGSFQKHRRSPPNKKEINIDGTKKVVNGIDASLGQSDDSAGDWMPAVSRSTHRRFLRRKARREHCKEENMDDKGLGDAEVSKQSVKEDDGFDIVNEGLDRLEISSWDNGSVDGSDLDTGSSEQSCMSRSLSESSVACVTTDFAMQNVLLQMGLRLLAPGGMQIRELHRWILKCHACYTVTAEIGRIFCPKCGNGGTLRKVAVTFGENGVVLAARRPRITLRGTKFSLPLPQGGRDAITKNLLLREDQLPQKFLRPKTNKPNKEGDFFFTPDRVFTHHTTDKRAPLQPPVRQALAVFSGKRNPNDNHYSCSNRV